MFSTNTIENIQSIIFLNNIILINIRLYFISIFSSRKNYQVLMGDGEMDRIVICRCEEVDLEEIEQTLINYQCSMREIKLRTRAGMGYCGGRTCRPALNAILEKVSGEKQPHQIPLKVQPPVRPVSLGRIGETNYE